MQQPRPVINVVLWILQGMLGVFYCFTGFGKMQCFRADVWNFTLHQPVPWFSAVPQSLFVFIGVCEFLGGVGLILPGLTGIKPKLTSLAAIGLTLVMILAAAFHILRGEFRFFLPMNLILAACTAVIAYGRMRSRPLGTPAVSVFRMVAGLAVLAVLVFVGYAPISYQLTHTR
jgi:hypothetical protein